MKEENEEKEPIKISTKEVFIIMAVVAILVLVFNSSLVKDQIITDSKESIPDEYYSYINDYEKKYEEFEETDDRLDCFKLKVTRTENSVVAVLENTGIIPFSDLKLYVIFYDGEKRPIAIDTEYIDCILPDGRWAGELYGATQQYETYDFLVEASNYDVLEKTEYFKNISISQTFDSTANMSVKFENNTDKKISAGVTALYYDSNYNIKGVEDFKVFDLKPNKTEEVKSYKYLDYQKENSGGVEILLTYMYIE